MQKANKDNFLMPHVSDVQMVATRLKGVVSHTPLMENLNLSQKYNAKILLKREDLQVVRSYKIRGAYNKISSLSDEEKKKGVVCASAGNHAQGVAYSCEKLNVCGRIYIPGPTPKQKIRQIEIFGKDKIEIIVGGDSFEDAQKEALKYCEENKMVFVHPFNDMKVIEGQATCGLEILNDSQVMVDYLIIPVGGGGLAAGVGSYFKQVSPQTKIIAVEPAGAPTMKKSLEAGHIVTLDNIDKFVDGAAVKKIGNLTFSICREMFDDILLIPEGKVCTSILCLYNEEAIVVEPAGALSIAALSYLKDKIEGKNVVCILSGSNNDITRTEEIKERSMLYEGLKHYFIIRFPQRAGALREFLEDVLGPNDDIAYFEYSKKISRETGPAVIGIELKRKSDFEPLIQRMKDNKISYEYLNDKPDLLSFLI